MVKGIEIKWTEHEALEEEVCKRLDDILGTYAIANPQDIPLLRLMQQKEPIHVLISNMMKHVLLCTCIDMHTARKESASERVTLIYEATKKMSELYDQLRGEEDPDAMAN